MIVKNTSKTVSKGKISINVLQTCLDFLFQEKIVDISLHCVALLYCTTLRCVMLLTGEMHSCQGHWE